MSAELLYRKNFSRAYTSVDLGAGDTQMTVKSNSTLPIANVSQRFRAVIWDYLTYPDPADDPDVEIVTANWTSGFTYNIVRGQEGTAAKAHPLGSKVSLNYTAGVSTDDLSVIGSKLFTENYTSNYFLRYNASIDKFELSSANIIASSGIPYGLSALRPASPSVGDWWFSTDTGSVYKCSTAGVWTSIIANISFTALGDVPSTYSGKSLQSLRCKSDETGLEFFVNGFIPNGMQAFTSDGTFVPPSGFTKFYVKMWGGGSSGTQGRPQSKGITQINGSGGGGGCYVEGVVEITTNQTVTIGRGQNYGDVLATDTIFAGIICGGGQQASSPNGFGGGMVAGVGGIVTSSITPLFSIPGKRGGDGTLGSGIAGLGGDSFCAAGAKSPATNGAFPGGGGAGESAGSTPGSGAPGLLLIYW